MVQPFSTVSFFSIWYWVLTIVLWTLVCQRTLGVPHDMVLRAARLPVAAERVDTIAHIFAERLTALQDRIGVAIAAVIGFGLAMLAVTGFGFDVESARAGFALVFPMTLVAGATLRLARTVRRSRPRGEALRAMLTRRRAWNQVIGILAMLAAALLAVGQHLTVLI